MAILDRYPQERELFGAVAWPKNVEVFFVQGHQVFHVFFSFMIVFVFVCICMILHMFVLSLLPPQSFIDFL